MRSANVKSLTRTKIFSEDNIKIKVHYDDLSGEKLQKAIDEVKNNFNGFKTLLGLKKDGTLSELQLYIYNNEDSYHKNTGSTMDFGYFSPELGSMYIHQTTYEPGGITLESAIMIAQNQRVLPNRDLIELDDNLQVNLYYNNLSDKQLKAAKQEIKDAFDDFKELYGVKEYDTTKTIGVFIHDNRQDFLNYGYTYANYCVNQVDRESTNVANAYHFIEHDSSRSLRKQVSFALSHYNGGHSFHVLPDKEEVIEFPDFNIQVKLGTNSLNDEQIEITKQEIIDALKYVKVDAPIEIKINKFNDLDNLDDDILVSLLKKVRPHESYNHESAKKALEDPIIQRDMPILSSIGDALQKTQVLLSNVETVKFPRYNLEIDLYYRDLDEHQIWRAKQEIKNTIYDFNESFDLKPSNTVHKSRILFYDTWDDYANYTGATHGGHADGTNAFCSLTYGYGVLRHEFMHNIVSYTGVDSDGALPELLNHNIVGHIQRGVYPTRDDELYDGAKHIDQYLKNSKFNVDERVYVTIEFFQEMYPGLINSIFYDRKSYGSALEFFKAKFPDMVSHIPSSDVDFYKNYDEKLLNKIFENKGVKQKLLDFIEVKLAEKKYIDEVRDLNAFRVLKGDHIGTNKNTDEEYYTGMIVDDRGEIGAFSPVEYSFLRKGIKVFNHATQDSIVIPKKYHNLKLVKVDSNYKLAFCDKHGNEYRNAKACENKTKNLLYTDDAQEAFTLVDLHSLKGITGKEENLGKIFSIKSANSKSVSSPISIYDDRKEVGSFTNEVGYVNRNKFYFKDSTDFKTYDENKALVIVTKEDDEHRLSLADGNYIDDDNKLLKQSIKLSGNEIDVDGTYCKDREYGQFLEREDTLLFRYGPGPENEKTITLSDNLEVKLYYDNLSDDVLQKIIDQIKEVDSKYPNLKALVEDNVSKPLQFYIYDTRNSYRAHTGSTKEHGHFDHSSNTMYTYKDPDADDAFLIDATQVAQNERVLPKRDTVQLNDDLQVVLCYNKLSDKELKVIKHKIKDAFDEYEELFGIEDHGTKTITFFLHDNEKDYNDYGYSYANYLLRQFDLDQTNILNAYHHVGHSNIPIRTQISYALSHHNVGRGLAMLPDREEVMELPDTEIQGNELEEDDSDYDDEYVGMQYKIIDDSLHITDSETNDTVKIPKQFKYLKLEEDDEGEYKLVLCDKKGHALSDNKKYAKIDDKYKYINTKAVNLDEDIEFDDYDGEDLFFIQPDETNSQVAKILDVYEDEIGMLPNNDFI